ncbi:MAG TPA: FTR1 family protein [Gemmatimonadaceae bacterium]|nr:FTR1 family protein [Gemmatimonadaceae bacterium]
MTASRPNAAPARLYLTCAALAAVFISIFAPVAGAQEHPARRLSSIVGVAIEEYGKAVDDAGRLVSQLEYQEATDFLADAQTVADRIAGAEGATARTILDSLVAAVAAKRPPAEVLAMHGRFAKALGAAGALEMPTRAIDLAKGRAIYQQSCASCHGALGMGDGAAARGMTPGPPALGSDTVMAGTSPATMFRIVSVGVTGTPMPAFGGTLSADDRWAVVAYATTLRARSSQPLEGEGLYLRNCASCHGTASSAPTFARALTKLPPDIASLPWQAERSDEHLAAVIRNGIPGTAMPPSTDLTAEQARSIVAYIRTLPMRAGAPVHTASGDRVADAPRTVLALLDQALAAARDGRTSDAGDRAFDAYIAFEPLETTTRAKNPGLIAGMERHFSEFKAAVRDGDVRSAERARDAIELSLPTVVELTRPTASGWGAFFQSFLIILREGFEAILVIGAVVTFLIKTGHRERLHAIWVGVGLALLASAVMAVVLSTVLSALPASREILEGVTMLIAVAVLFSVSYWLISKVEAAKWQAFIRDKVNAALAHGGGKALALVAFLAVFREGAETALFYQALFREGTHVIVPLGLGIVVGMAALAVIFTLFYRFGVRIPLRPFFGATSALLYYMAFVFAGKGIKELQEGNVLPVTRLPGFPTVEAMGIYPTAETLLAQLVLLAAFVFALFKTFWPSRSVALPTVPAGASPDVAARVAELAEQNARLQARIAALEDAASARGGPALASDEAAR